MVTSFCRNNFSADNSHYTSIVFTNCCSLDDAISMQVNTLNKCLSSFCSLKVFSLFTKNTNLLIQFTLLGDGLSD